MHHNHMPLKTDGKVLVATWIETIADLITNHRKME